MHLIICISFYALYSMNCILWIALFKWHSVNCIFSIKLNAMYSMHWILWIGLYALHSIHFILYIALYALHSLVVLVIIVHAFYFYANSYINLYWSIHFTLSIFFMHIVLCVSLYASSLLHRIILSSYNPSHYIHHSLWIQFRSFHVFVILHFTVYMLGI